MAKHNRYLKGGSSNGKKQWTPPWTKSEIKPYDKVWFNGRQVTWQEVQKWIEAVKKDPEMVRAIQGSIGMPFDTKAKKHSGVWGTKTDFYFREWLLRQSKDYDKALEEKKGKEPSYLSFDRGQYYPPGTDLNKQYSEADKRALEVQAFQNQQYEKQQEEALSRKQKIMNEVGSWYQEATGFSISDPTSPLYGKVSQKDLLGKYLGGWDYDNYFFWARNRPEIKNRYPGLNDDLTITEYNQARQLAQTIAIQKLGYPLSKTQLEIAIKTGEIPKAGMSTGSPLIGAQ